MTIAILTVGVSFTNAQQNYNDFEDKKHFNIIFYKSGRLNVRAKNPGADTINNSARCAKYRRTKNNFYDNIKLLLIHNLADVAAYASYSPDAPKIKMKVYTSAPVGTLVEIQLGKHADMVYPKGVHSHYQALTTKQNEWEELNFNFSHKPKGSFIKSEDVNQVTILFAPRTTRAEVFYFDDLTGPPYMQKLLLNKKRTGAGRQIIK